MRMPCLLAVGGQHGDPAGADRRRDHFDGFPPQWVVEDAIVPRSTRHGGSGSIAQVNCVRLAESIGG
jgi:hypothetical protein